VNASAFIRGSRIVEPQPSADQGTFTVALSPYDVPEAVRAHLDDSNGCFVIDLRYITSEPTVEVRKDPVTLMRGAGSGRIYQIKVLAPNTEAIEMDVPNEIREALKKLEGDEKQGFGPRERIKVVEDVINEEEEKLFGMAPVLTMLFNDLGTIETLFSEGPKPQGLQLRPSGRASALRASQQTQESHQPLDARSANDILIQIDNVPDDGPSKLRLGSAISAIANQAI
jgi:hypothetical protein